MSHHAQLDFLFQLKLSNIGYYLLSVIFLFNTFYFECLPSFHFIRRNLEIKVGKDWPRNSVQKGHLDTTGHRQSALRGHIWKLSSKCQREREEPLAPAHA